MNSEKQYRVKNTFIEFEDSEEEEENMMGSRSLRRLQTAPDIGYSVAEPYMQAASSSSTSGSSERRESFNRRDSNFSVLSFGTVFSHTYTDKSALSDDFCETDSRQLVSSTSPRSISTFLDSVPSNSKADPIHVMVRKTFIDVDNDEVGKKNGASRDRRKMKTVPLATPSTFEEELPMASAISMPVAGAKSCPLTSMASAISMPVSGAK
jgi:hypothetical protein